MAAIVYTFVVRDGGDPTAATGLTPTFVEYRDIVAGTDLSAGAPTVTEVGNGHYKFSVDWDTAPESTGPSNYIAMVIDAGAGLTDANERYIVGRINRTDDFASTVVSIDGKVDTIDTVVDAILVDTDSTLPATLTTIEGKIDTIDTVVDLLLEIETGKWEVTANQLKVYQSDGVTLVKTFNLFDSAGNPTSTDPSRREPIP